MTHANAPLTPTGRRRMVLRHLDDGLPQAHVAAEFRVSRPTVATWVARYRAAGEAGLYDRSSRPGSCPSQISSDLIAEIDSLRRQKKWSARRIHHHLQGLGYQLHLRTVGRWLHRLGISRLRDLTPDGENLRRAPQRIRAGWAGHMIHLDVKKLGRIPDGGGWWAHGRGSQQPWLPNAPTSSAWGTPTSTQPWTGSPAWPTPRPSTMRKHCLLYTSDAADDAPRV